MMLMLRSHRIALMPVAWQDLLFRQHAGYARYAFNWAIDEFSAGLSVGDWCNDLTLRPRFNVVKYLIAPWAAALSQNASKGAIYRRRLCHRGLGTVSAATKGRSEAGTEDRFSEIQKAGRPHGIPR